jgi:hypothetical protein
MGTTEGGGRSGRVAPRLVVRTVQAPTETEARTMAAPVLAAFRRDGWQLEEDLWIPGDRRVSLGESLVLGAEDENLLESMGTLRLGFLHADPTAPAPEVEPSPRVPDAWEQIGGVRYRRMVPRWIIGAIGFVIVLIIIITVMMPRFQEASRGMGRFPDRVDIPGVGEVSCDPATGVCYEIP